VSYEATIHVNGCQYTQKAGLNLIIFARSKPIDNQTTNGLCSLTFQVSTSGIFCPGKLIVLDDIFHHNYKQWTKR